MDFERELDQIKASKLSRKKGANKLGDEEKKRIGRIRSARQHARTNYAFNYVRQNHPELHEAIRKRVAKEYPI